MCLTRNNYDKNIFNGDTGIVQRIAPDTSGLTVRFNEESIEYKKGELGELALAYAISIHKSQGSEYPVIIIPLLKQHFMMLQRNLVYTGITRARSKVYLVGSTDAYAMAVRNNKTEVRRTHLQARLRDPKTNEEEEIIFSDEEVIVPGISLAQKDKNTDDVHLSYSSPKTPGRTYLYNLKTKERKLLKEQEIPSGHNSDDYIVERLECSSHDNRFIPLTITRHKNTPVDGSANLLLYGYGSYGSSMTPNFSSTRLSLIDRDIIWVTAHIRGGMEKGMKWWKEGKLLNKKNTFEDYIAVAKSLIEKKYTSKGKIIGMGGSAGGLLMGAVVNKNPELFKGIVMAVPFVDSLTTNLDHSLPLTVGEFDEFGNAKENKEHFDYIYSYAPYNNIKKMDYPNILITTSLSDNRVLFDEPAKFTAKLREHKTDNNLLLLKTEMNAGHGGKSGRDGAIEEIALDYSFILKITDKI